MHIKLHFLQAMILRNSSVEILPSDWYLKGIFRAIEEAGRTCYKSIGTRYFRLENEPKNDDFLKLVDELREDPRVTCKRGPFFDDSYYVSIPHKYMKDYVELEQYPEETFENSALYENLTADDFVQMIINNGHGAMLEHGTVYLKISHTSPLGDPEYLTKFESVQNYQKNKFSKVNIVTEDHYKYDNYITTNYRVIVENGWEDDLKYLCEPTEFHELRVSTRFICDRSVSHELVRHRAMSFGQESQRFCDYGKAKYNGQITFIIPHWVKYIDEGEAYWYDGINYCTGATEENHYMGSRFWAKPFETDDVIEWDNELRFIESLDRAERAYMAFRKAGLKAQDARAILPNATKTEIVVTGFVSDWKHFFELRTSERAHPDMRKLALDLEDQFKNLNLI